MIDKGGTPEGTPHDKQVSAILSPRAAGWCLTVWDMSVPGVFDSLTRHEFAEGEARPPSVSVRDEVLQRLGFGRVPGARWWWRESDDATSLRVFGTKLSNLQASVDVVQVPFVALVDVDAEPPAEEVSA
jgi:hypothetical protein